MKNPLLILLLINFTNAFCQTVPPQAFSYSAVARNNTGNLLTNQSIGLQFSILKGSTVGVVVYQENQFTTTNQFGLFELMIGTGTVQSGTFSNINWGNDNYYLKVGLDATGGTNFQVMGTTQFLSVPYAMYAKSAGSAMGSSTMGSNNYVVKFNGVPISDSSINEVCTSFYGGNFSLLTQFNYWHNLFTLGNNTEQSLAAQAYGNFYTTDTINNSSVYWVLGSSNSLVPNGTIVYEKSNITNGFYYVPFSATAANYSNLYFWNTYTNSYVPAGNNQTAVQVLPNNPTVTGFNVTLPVTVTIAR